MEYELVLAGPADTGGIWALIEVRVAWMDEQGIRQWNTTGYREAYPPAYDEEQAAAGRLYVLKRRDSGAIAGAAVLLEEDPRWEDSREALAYYVHNFVTAVSEKGAGGELLRQAEEMAKSRGKTAMRLDCATDNAPLNAYYENKGYRLRGQCTDGPYTGNKREKQF